jgi:hypothetical protein
MLCGLISLVVLDIGGPSSFSVGAVDVRSFCIDGWDIAHRVGGWAYKGSAAAVEVPVCVGNRSPEVADTIDTIIDELEKDWGNGVGEMDKILIRGMSIDEEEECLICCKG